MIYPLAPDGDLASATNLMDAFYFKSNIFLAVTKSPASIR